LHWRGEVLSSTTVELGAFASSSNSLFDHLGDGIAENSDAFEVVVIG